MKKIKIIALLAIAIINLSSCIVLRSSDYQLESSRTLLTNGIASDEEDNVGVEFPAQILYIPMYVLFGGLSAVFAPFSKEFYKNDLTTIIIDADSGSNLDPTGDPKFFMIPKCKNGLLQLAVGFMGKESELMIKSKDYQTTPRFLIKREDFMLKANGKTVEPNSVFLAGTLFNKISSRSVLVRYPIARKKRISYRFIEYPHSCKDVENDGVDIVISRIFDNKNSLESSFKFPLVREMDKLYEVNLKKDK